MENYNENSKNEIEIDVRGLISAVLNRMTIIILVGILVGGIAFAYTQYFIDPQYVSTTKVYILSKQSSNDTEQLNANDLAFATYLANDYQVLLTSQPVLQEVKDKLKLEQTTNTLANMISVELIEDTRIMKISVVSVDPKLAKNIADTVRDVANAKTKNVMDGIEAVNSIDEANLPINPSSPNVEKNTMIGFLAGFGLALLAVVVMFILDDTIKNPDDIEKRLGVSVLASIPLKSESSSSYGTYGRYKKSPPSKKKTKKPKKDDSKNDTKGKE